MFPSLARRALDLDGAGLAVDISATQNVDVTKLEI